MSNLRLVGPGDRPHEEDFAYLPLPHFPWDERPLTVPLDIEECATAIHIAKGLSDDAARILKTSVARFNRMLKAHPRLVRIRDEHLQVLNDRAIGEVARAFDSEDAKRREWAASKILQSRLAIDNPLAQAPQAAIQNNLNMSARDIVFSWRTSPTVDNPPTIDDSGASDEIEGEIAGRRDTD